MRLLTRLIASSLLAAVLAAMPALPFITSHGGAVASSIAFLVNDDPVTEYDVQQRTRLIKLTNRGQGTRQQAVDELIEERLKQQAAGRLGVTANEAEVEQAFNNIAQRVKLSPSQLSQALQQNGVSPETLKRRLRADLAWRDVVRGRLRQSARLQDGQIQAELSKRGDEARATSFRYTLQPIVFVVPEGSSSAYQQQRMQEASRYRQQFTGCQTALDVAKAFRDTVVQEQIRRSSAELPEDLTKSLNAMAVGGTTAPERIENGVRILALCGRDEIQDTTAAQQEIRSEMLNEEGQRLSRRLLIDLKQAAVIEYR